MTLCKCLNLFAIICVACLSALAADANRLTYLDDFNPFAPDLNFPKLTTPQWVGEPGVEAVVILSIDDMMASEKFEEFLRPILERLKKIDERAPVSIFCNAPDPADPRLQTFLKDGVSLEIHTLHHPCPLLAKGNFASATNTYHGCVDLLNHVPGNKPVAYRMPCCDSMNSLTPRFLAEIFNRANSAGQFLSIDSSVLNITTKNDASLPRKLTIDADGKEKFRKYVPFPLYAAFIEDYPYPYQIGKAIWEFPFAAPSDWQGQNHFKTNSHPTVVVDWISGLDVAVKKQGVFTLLFHPHGWICSDQIIELIDYAEQKYGKKIKFLNFREAQKRLDKNLLADQPLRGADGQKNGVRLVDLNNDGYMDVVIGNDELRRTRVWNPKKRKWSETDFPIQLLERKEGKCFDADARFGVLQKSGFVSFIVRDETFSGAWDFNGKKWVENKSLLNGLNESGQPVLTRRNGASAGFRLRDLDNDGRCEVIISDDKQNAVFHWSPQEKSWRKLPFALPDTVRITDTPGRDLGVRFVDVNEDGFADVLFSNEDEYSLHLFVNENNNGWSRKICSGKRGDKDEIPMMVRGGKFPNNGAWFRNRALWVQNEDTAEKPGLVDRRSFDELLSLEVLQPSRKPVAK